MIHSGMITIKRALLSVSDKQGIVELAKGLHDLGVEIISTGGTALLLAENQIPVIPVSELTGFPETMNGRVKTLHPIIHGGILGLRDRHDEDAGTHGIPWIDLVACNLYPFESSVDNPETSLERALEHIDIGGPTMIRAAAKNLGWVGVLTDPKDYQLLLDELNGQGGVSYATRRKLSAAAFRHTAQYDAVIQQYLTDTAYPESVTLTFRKHSDLRYGENPHQTAAAYRAVQPPQSREDLSVLDAAILNGKALSYNNIQDAAGALRALREFSEPACVVVKHAAPCGAAVGEEITAAAVRAFEADRLSAFGGIVALNRECTKELAEYLHKVFFEIILAPSYQNDALAVLKQKKQLRILQIQEVTSQKNQLIHRMVPGGMLMQDCDVSSVTRDQLNLVTKQSPTEDQIRDMLFAWKVLKHIKSNGILTVKNGVTLGIGQGQVSRVDAVKIALDKTADTDATVLASDAFFPFRDSIDVAAARGITAIIQPGGSRRDDEVIQACNEHGIAMVCTGIRCFLH